jgi:hypothetical protein
MFDDHLNFHLHNDGERNSVTVFEQQPEKRRAPEYLPAGEDPTHRGYTEGFGYIDDCRRRRLTLIFDEQEDGSDSQGGVSTRRTLAILRFYLVLTF